MEKSFVPALLLVLTIPMWARFPQQTGAPAAPLLNGWREQPAKGNATDECHGVPQDRLVGNVVADGRSASPGPILAATLPPAQEITIDLSVRDRKGRPFRKLEPPDLEIKDDGTPVKIKDLRLVTAQDQEQMAPGRAARAQTIAFVFDAAMAERRRARQAAEEIVKRAGPGTWFAVFYAGRQLSLVQPYTQDRMSARDAIERATFQPTKRLPRGAAASTSMPNGPETTYSLPPENTQAGQLARISFESSVEAGEVAAEENTRSPVAGLLALARSHGHFQGRKAVVLFSQWLQLTTRLQMLLRDTLATANRANLSVFIFDTTELSQAARRSASSLFGGPSSVGMALGSGAGGAGRMDAAQQTLMERLPYLELNASTEGQAPMRELSNGTGGFYQSDLRDLDKPVRRLIDAVETHYEASFVSAASDFDGRYRPVTVALKKPSLRVQTQSGYVALPPGATPDTRPFEIPLLKILAAEPLPETVDFRSKILNMGRTLALVVEIPLNDLSGLEDASSQLFSLHFSVLARIRSAGGETLRTFSQEVPYRIALERRQQAQSGVFTFYRQFSLPAGDYTLECAVLDQNTKLARAERRALRVEPLPEGPLISDISLVRQLEPFPDGNREDRYYFRYKDSKVVPNLATSFTALAGMPLRFFLMVEPLPGGRPDLQVQLSRDGVMVVDSTVQASADRAGDAIPLLFSLPAASLTTGNYLIRVRAAQGGQARERTTTVQVEGVPVQAGDAPGSHLPDLQPVGTTQDAPGSDELQPILDGIGKRALEYTRHLPNFGCLVVTRRWVDPSGLEQWRAKDSYVELVRVSETDEEHKLVELNGKVPKVDLQGMRSSGEFGALLKMALDPAYHPQVQWKEWTLLGNRLVQVFSYRVEPQYSTLNLFGNLFSAGPTHPGYHGLLYVEPDTLNIRRLTLAADFPHDKSGSPEVSVVVDYDYIALGQRDHVLPVQAEVRVRTRHGALMMNQLEFRGYRRFSAESAITFEQP